MGIKALMFLGTSLLLNYSAVSAIASGSDRASPPANGVQAAASSAGSNEAAVNRKLIAYYFHGNKRCHTCKTIEAYTREALQSAFPEQVQNGTLEFKLVNLDDSENEHFVNEFELSTRTVVIQEFVDGKPTRWKKLDKVWDVVDDRQDFFNYVQPEVKAWISAS
jgi:hypothetical protein